MLALNHDFLDLHFDHQDFKLILMDMDSTCNTTSADWPEEIVCLELRAGFEATKQQ